MILLLCIIIFLLIIIGFLLYQRLKNSEKRANLLIEKHEALSNKIDNIKLENLESRLNPHLFKNILNSIQSHAYQTYYALDKLANVLDYILYESRKKFVSPKEEIDFALNLIEINKIKVSPLFELKLKTKIDEQALLYSSPVLAPLISIDLIENAFKHADLQSEDSFISIVIEFKDNCFSITVSNKISDQQALKKEKSGNFGYEINQPIHFYFFYIAHSGANRYYQSESYLIGLFRGLLFV
jgi:sensor histidine kinase YesM